MTTAWLDYDPETGDILKISWRKIAGETIEIPANIAEDFITGEKKLSNYIITGLPDQPIFVAKQELKRCPRKFWQLINILDNTVDCPKITILHDQITICSNNVDINVTLYMTKKDDPSWLISSWKISELPLTTNDISTLPIPLAQSYSYFIGF